MRRSIFAIFIFWIVTFHQATAGDYYVATTGNNTTGNGSQSQPWKTITHALSQITGTVINPHVIHVAPGIYSPSLTGETYPLIMKSYVSLIGAGKEITYLDAETNPQFTIYRRVIECNEINNISMCKLTMKRGFAPRDSVQGSTEGGGIYMRNCSYIYLDNDSITSNFAYNYSGSSTSGGGIYCISGNYIQISNCVIAYNGTGADGSGGGGVSLHGDHLLITHNTFIGNGAMGLFGAEGGGLFIFSQGGIIGNNDFFDNTASGSGGAISVYGRGLIIRNNIQYNQSHWMSHGGGGIYTDLDFAVSLIIGGSINNGNNIFNNSCDFVIGNDTLGKQMAQFFSTLPIIADHNFFGESIDPHSTKEVYCNFLLDPYMTEPVVFDTSGLVIVPSPVKFDTICADSVKTINAAFFNVVNSLYDSITVSNISFTSPAFTASPGAVTIHAVDNVVVGVTFQPDSPGVYTDTMTIATNRGNFKIEISGVAVPPLTIDDPTQIKTFHLLQNYPNPFNPSTAISYRLAVNSKVSLKIYMRLVRKSPHWLINVNPRAIIPYIGTGKIGSKTLLPAGCICTGSKRCRRKGNLLRQER